MRRSLFSREHRGLRAAAPFRAHQRTDIEDHDDAAVAQDRRARDAADRGDLRSDRLDDDLAAADELVRDEPGRMLAGAHEHDRDRHVLLRQRRGLEADEARERLEAILLPVVIERRGFAAQMAAHFGLREAQHAFHGRQRQRVILLARAHDQRMADSERERQADGE